MPDGVVFVGVAIRGHHRVLEQLQGDRALEARGGDQIQVLVLLPQELLDRLLDRLGLEIDDEDEDGLINNIDMSNSYQYV